MLLGAALFAGFLTASSMTSQAARGASDSPSQSTGAPTVFLPMALKAAGLPGRPDHGEVVFQVATVGRGDGDSPMGYWPAMSPWFTLYADGTYLRMHPDLATVSIERRAGRLDASTLNDFLRQLIDEIEFYELSAQPDLVHHEAAAPTDYVYLSAAGRTHRMAAFGLSSMRRFPASPCAIDSRFVLLADFIARLTEPLSDDETAYTVRHGYLVAHRTASVPEAPDWPVSEISLASADGRAQSLGGELAADVAQAIAGHATVDPRHARFQVGNDTVWVGFLVAFPGWDACEPGPSSQPPACNWP